MSNSSIQFQIIDILDDEPQYILQEEPQDESRNQSHNDKVFSWKDGKFISIDSLDKSPKRPPSPHNGKPISMIEISPNGKYLVTYSEENKTIIGQNLNNLEQNKTVNVNSKRRVLHMCISDEKILAYINNYCDVGK